MNFFNKQKIEIRQPFNVNELEAEIAAEFQRHSESAERYMPKVRYAPPEMSVEEVARITGDVIRASHEAAAVALNLLGKELEERVIRIDQMKVDAQDTLRSCQQLMESYRTKGVKDAELIEATSRLNEEARGMIEAMRLKLEEVEYGCKGDSATTTGSAADRQQRVQPQNEGL